MCIIFCYARGNLIFKFKSYTIISSHMSWNKLTLKIVKAQGEGLHLVPLALDNRALDTAPVCKLLQPNQKLVKRGLFEPRNKKRFEIWEEGFSKELEGRENMGTTYESTGCVADSPEKNGGKSRYGSGRFVLNTAVKSVYRDSWPRGGTECNLNLLLGFTEHSSCSLVAVASDTITFQNLSWMSLKAPWDNRSITELATNFLDFPKKDTTKAAFMFTSQVGPSRRQVI